MNWFYAVGQQQQGPVTEEQLHALVKDRVVTGDTKVWREGMADWQPYSVVSGGAAPPAGAPGAAGTVFCAECGKAFSAAEVVRFGDRSICAACQPTFAQRMQAGAVTTGAPDYATFGSRFGAKMLDGLILMVVNVGLGVVVGMAIGGGGGEPNLPVIGLTMLVQLVINFIINFSYGIFFLGKFGATPGKMACKIKVVRPDGSPLGYGRACGRVFAEILSGMICYIGYIMAGFDEEKRSLHDRICDTRVIKKG